MTNDDFEDDLDEGPDEADVRRFGGWGKQCQSCGADMYDDAHHCPACGTMQIHPGNEPVNLFRRHPVAATVIALALVVALLFFTL